MQQQSVCPQVRFVMDEGTTLADLLELNLHECEDEVKNIVDKAVKEMSMEKILRDLDTTWGAMELEQEVHPRTGTTLLRASEELVETLEDNQVGRPARVAYPPHHRRSARWAGNPIHGGVPGCLPHDSQAPRPGRLGSSIEEKKG